MTDWALIEDAVVAAEFWFLDKCSGERGLDRPSDQVDPTAIVDSEPPDLGYQVVRRG